MDKAIRWLKATLDYEFADARLFTQALTHRSADGGSNERLEFLGDAVLDTVISEIVFRAMPHADEGDLSRLRSSLVKDKTLAELGGELGIGEYLILGGGEKKTGGHRRASILADAVEALFGAVYLDQGFAAAAKIIVRVYGERLEHLPDPRGLRDSKTQLQEWLQARKMNLPEYQLAGVSGQAHRQVFEVRCVIEGVVEIAIGRGSSRRSAEQQSARHMLAELTGTSDGS
ncbi:MAG TPA: ribonuclease III [Woeseiaceae bacterium]|nr:ribonuclease III [Woeseiaceae bacterium]